MQPTELSIHQIGLNIQTQDNRITALPIFIVQQRHRVWGLSEGYAENFAWIETGEDCAEADAELTKWMDQRRVSGRPNRKGWQRIGYVDRWDFVTACFTESGCKAYLEANGHNLKEPRIYVETGYRNREWEIVRNLLIFMGSAAAEESAPCAEDMFSLRDRWKRKAAIQAGDSPADDQL